MENLIHWLTKYFDLTWWTLFGFVAQGCFFMRFFVQWLASEKRKRSYMPKAFWYFSLLGSVLFLIYGVGRRDLVIFLGQTLAFSIYLRNLILYEDVDKVYEMQQEVEELRKELERLRRQLAKPLPEGGAG